MSEEQEPPITLKRTASSLLNAANAAASYDLRPVGRLINRVVMFLVSIGLVIGIGMLAVKRSGEEKRRDYERAVYESAPLSPEVHAHVRRTFSLIQADNLFDTGKYKVINSRAGEEAERLLAEIGAYCESSGRLYAAQNSRYPYHVAFETKTFKGLEREGVRKCVDSVVRRILNPDN